MRLVSTVIYEVGDKAIYHITNQGETAQLAKGAMEYADYVSIMLTSVSVILAVLALLIGLLALWGYSQFKDMTQKASQQHLETMLKDGWLKEKFESLIIKHISEQLKEGELREIIVERVDRVILTDADTRAKDEAATQDIPDKPYTDE